MLQSHLAFTDLSDSSEAGTYLGARVRQAFDGRTADAVLLFVSPRYDAEKLVAAVHAACNPTCLVGASTEGGFISSSQTVGAAIAIALRSDEMRFGTGVARELHVDHQAAAREMVSTFNGLDDQEYPYRSALILTEMLAGHVDEFIGEVTLRTSGKYQLFGGGTGADTHSNAVHVLCGTEVLKNAAVALEICSKNPIAVGVHHGWQPVGEPLRVTAAQANRVISLNARPVLDVFQAHARSIGQRFDASDPGDFFIHNALGIDTGQGHKIRIPIDVHEDSSIACAAEVPAGAMVQIMRTTAASSREATMTAVRSALNRLEGRTPRLALFFDRVASRLRWDREFGLELSFIEKALGPSAKFAGFNTHGQIARVEGQFNGFHNSTAVVCILAE